MCTDIYVQSNSIAYSPASIYLGDIISRINLQLEQIGGNAQAINLRHQAITIWYLWAIPVELINKPHPAQQQSLELCNKIHIANPALAKIYLDVLIGCITVDGNQVIGGPGTEQALVAASLCLLCALSVRDPTPIVDNNIYQCYFKTIPHNANFDNLLCYHTINVIHALFNGRLRRHFGWMGYAPSPQECAIVAKNLVQVAHRARKPQEGPSSWVIERQGKLSDWPREHQDLVPDWALHFVIQSLSSDPLPSASIITSCLLILAINQGWNIPSGGTVVLDRRYVYS